MKKIGGILLVLGMVACAREPEVADLVKNMVVETRYDVAEVDGTDNVFNDYSTFVLRQDTMGFVSTYSNDTILLDNPSTIVDFVKSTIERVETSATGRGYTRVEEDENPDFAIKMVVLENFSFFQSVTYPGYYSGYYGYYGGYYGPVVNTYTSNFVTLVIEVVDVKNYAANGNKYKVIWSAYIGDLLSSVDRKTKLLEAVDQAFVQSPYFSKD